MIYCQDDSLDIVLVEYYLVITIEYEDCGGSDGDPNS